MTSPGKDSVKNAGTDGGSASQAPNPPDIDHVNPTLIERQTFVPPSLQARVNQGGEQGQDFLLMSNIFPLSTADAGSSSAAWVQPVDTPGVTKHTDSPQAGSSHPTVSESKHVMKKGDRLETIARQTLGPNASKQDISNYVTAIEQANGIADPTKIKIGSPLTLPELQADGTYSYASSQNKDERITVHPDGRMEAVDAKTGRSCVSTIDKSDPRVTISQYSGPNPDDRYTERTTNHPDGSFDVVNTTTGVKYTHVPDKNNPNAYVEKYSGPKPEDNYELRQHADGSFERLNQDGTGFTSTTDKHNPRLTIEKHHGPTPDDNYELRITNYADGSSFSYNATNGSTANTVPDKVDPDNNYTIQHRGPDKADNYNLHYSNHADHSYEVTSTDGTSYSHVPDKDDPQSYVEHHKGPGKADNYDVQYKHHPDGSFEVINSDGTSYSHILDKNDPQSYVEHHKGPKKKDNYDVQYKHHSDGSYEVTDSSNGTKLSHIPDKHDPRSYVEHHTGPAATDNYDIYCKYHSDGSFDISNSDGRSVSHKPTPGYPGSYTEEHRGPKPEDNYTKSQGSDGKFSVYGTADGTSYTHSPAYDDPTVLYSEDHHGPKPDDNYTLYQQKDGSSEQTYDDGRKIVTTPGKVDPDKNYVEKHTGPKPEDNYTYECKDGNGVSTDPSGRILLTYDKSKDATTRYRDDGSKSVVFNSDGHTETTSPDGKTKETKWKDGSYQIEESRASGTTTRLHKVDASGNYTETGTGPNPNDNYEEKYDSKSGITLRTEAKGTDRERTITTKPDGTTTVIAKDGDNYTRNADGSEHHTGRETFDKPAYDYQTADKSRAGLESAIQNHQPPISADEQAAMAKDMKDFETRAQQQHLPPEEISKTYDQMSRLLSTPNKDSAIPDDNRVKLAEGILHECAHPSDIDQGAHQTCNVTTVAEQGFSRNPSTMAEMAATTAIKGEWTAPDGKVIKVDNNSLAIAPFSEEQNQPPKDGERSYATQVLNVVMINDCTQRRVPPQYYQQQVPDGSVPADTGERLYGADGKLVTAKVMNGDGQQMDVPVAAPYVTDGELTSLGKRLYHKNYDSIGVNDESIGVENVNSPGTLELKVKQMQDQGKLPITMGVDCNHKPITNNEQPGFGGHVVTIDGYNPVTHQIHISNQYGKDMDKWVTPQDLYDNASGKYAGLVNANGAGE